MSEPLVLPLELPLSQPVLHPDSALDASVVFPSCLASDQPKKHVLV